MFTLYAEKKHQHVHKEFCKFTELIAWVRKHSDWQVPVAQLQEHGRPFSQTRLYEYYLGIAR